LEKGKEYEARKIEKKELKDATVDPELTLIPKISQSPSESVIKRKESVWDDLHSKGLEYHR
jgi:hypothetical protein